MGKPFLSRHFLGEQADCLQALPFAAPGAAEGGVATAHNLLALGTWSEDAQVRPIAMRWQRSGSLLLAPPNAAAAACRLQESRLTVIDLAVGQAGDEIAGHPSLKRLASFQTSGRVAAVEVRRQRA